MPDEIVQPPPPAPIAATPPNPIDRYNSGDPSQLAEAMLAPGEREPDIDPAGLDSDALRVIRGLRSEGFQAYLVGGCVRDLLVGRTPKDFDIATSAHPGEIRSTFRNCRLIGRRFRLAHVYFRGNKIIEVATFRRNPNGTVETEPEEPALTNGAGVDAEAEVGAEPGAEVEVETEATPDLLIREDNTFGSAEEDARRRDFTINGLFYDVILGRVLDYVGGLRDLDLRLIRTINDPEVRLREDPIRLLRAVRFACKLGFDIEPLTYAACEGAVEDLPRCAPARLLEETFKVLRGGAAAPSVKLLDALGALPMLLPAIHHALKEGGEELEHAIQAMLAQVDLRVAEAGSLDDAIIFAALLEPIAHRNAGGTAIEQLLEELVRTSRLPRRIADRVKHLLSAQEVLSGGRARRRSLASFRRTPYFEDALTLFALKVGATGEGADLLEKWRSGHVEELEAQPLTNGNGNGNGTGGPPGRRKRRRRGRSSESKPAESKPVPTS